MLKILKPSTVKAVGGLGILLDSHLTTLHMWTIILILVVLFIIAALSGKSEQTGHWSHLFADMQHDPETFYELVEEKLKEREVPDFKSSRKTFNESTYGLLSHNRLYLEVSRADYIFHICAAPWGTGFFFSSWTRTKSKGTIFEKLPVIGKLIAEASQYEAYYKLDTDGMFRSSVHQAILSAIDSLTEAKGMKGLTELERKPDLRSLLK